MALPVDYEPSRECSDSDSESDVLEPDTDDHCREREEKLKRKINQLRVKLSRLKKKHNTVLTELDEKKKESTGLTKEELETIKKNKKPTE